MLRPRLDVLAASQRALWHELEATPPGFILYGGTAIALRLGHRPSVDFDFFSFEPFQPRALFMTTPYLEGAALLQSAANTLTCRVERSGPVQVSYFGDLAIGQVEPPDRVAGPGFPIAALIDLGGTKVSVITQRAEARDYIDVHALLGAGISLREMLAAGIAIYGRAFSPLLALKAIAYHEEPALARLPAGLRKDLVAAVKSVDPVRLPTIKPIRARREKS
jgi:hypothetical protein